MEYRKLGNSDFKLSLVTFGAWAAGGWMWGGADRDDAVDAIRAAYDSGITSVDTAPAYGQGRSEEIVGEAISILPRDKVQVLTKYGLRWDTDKGTFYFGSKDNNGTPINMHKLASKESIVKECEDSLKRLRTDYIDLYQIHWPDPTTPVQETMEAINKLISDGKVRYAGVCNYDVELMEEAEKYINLASDQVPYSMLRRNIEKELVPYMFEKKKSVLAYSPLQFGLLTGKMKPDQKFSDGDLRNDSFYFKKENIIQVNSFLNKIKPIAEDKGITLAQLVIRWTVEQPGITIALVGARNPKQALENAKAADIKISKGEMDFINKELEKVELFNRRFN